MMDHAPHCHRNMAGGTGPERLFTPRAERPSNRRRSMDRFVNTVLLVDDEHEICLLLSSMLERAGSRCVIAHSLAEGRAALKKGVFDAVFLDVNLPDGPGYSLIPEIKAVDTATACVAVSAIDNESHRALAAGADTFVAKPFDRETILSSLRDLGFNT